VETKVYEPPKGAIIKKKEGNMVSITINYKKLEIGKVYIVDEETAVSVDKEGKLYLYEIVKGGDDRNVQ